MEWLASQCCIIHLNCELCTTKCLYIPGSFFYPAVYCPDERVRVRVRDRDNQGKNLTVELIKTNETAGYAVTVNYIYS